MKIYIAGKITGDPNYREKFAEAAELVEQNGNIALNPATLPKGLEPGDYAKLCYAMIDVADAVLFLPDWITSKGADIEYQLCRYIGKRMMKLSDPEHGGK